MVYDFYDFLWKTMRQCAVCSYSTSYSTKVLGSEEVIFLKYRPDVSWYIEKCECISRTMTIQMSVTG